MYDYEIMELIIYFIAMAVFGSRTVLFLIGSFNERKKDKAITKLNEYPTVSVIVPARNEENKIEDCIRSIEKSDYPNDKFEIVAINDRSEDNTGIILDKLKNELSNLRVIHIKNSTDKGNLIGKPGALHAGIQSSKSELILMTDADCTVPGNWIRTIASVFKEESVGIVPSFTTIKGNRIFDKVQSVEWVYTHTMASAGVGIGYPLGCYGNNLSIRRNDYEKAGGYENIKFTVTEDLALLNSVILNGKKARYVTSPESLVTTLPCKDFREYKRQHHRWAVGGKELGWKAVIFVITTAIFWIGFLSSIYFGNYLFIFGLLGFRILCDFALMAPVMHKLKLKKLIPWAFPSILFFIVWELVVPILLIDRKVIWKGQVFR